MRDVPEKKEENCEPIFEKRFLSTFSYKGATAFYETFETLADKIYTLPYACGAANLAIARIAEEANNKLYPVTVFADPLLPQTVMGAVFPTEKLAVLALSPTFEAAETKEFAPFRGSTLTDITDGAADGACGILFEQATDKLKNAKAHHDALERIFIKNMDFEKVGRITASLMTRIFSE